MKTIKKIKLHKIVKFETGQREALILLAFNNHRSENGEILQAITEYLTRHASLINHLQYGSV